MWFIREDCQRRIGTHCTYRVFTIFCHRYDHTYKIFLSITKGLLLFEQIFYFWNIAFISLSNFRQVDNMFFYPFIIWQFSSNALFDFFVGNNALFLCIDEKHFAWFQTTFSANIFSVFVYYTHFGRHNNAIISCYIVTSRTQTITVKYATDNSTISEAHSSRAIPWFHHEAIELIEVMFFLAHEIIAFPRFRNHHHNRMRQGTTCHVQEFQSIVEHSGVRTAVIYYREYLFNIWE